jgi:filamentous hemagglutinin family protein
MRNVGKISKNYYVRQVVACFLVYCLFFSPAVMADIVLTGQEPGSGITVTPGTLPNTTDMTAGNNGIGYFSDFDIDLGHTVNCVQGSPAYNALFKVDSVDGTQIYGIFNSDGNIYLQDLRGIMIGATGEINMNSFIGSTVSIKNSDWQDFVNGVTDQLRFEKGMLDPTGVMENHGAINASKVYLIGSRVLNSGTINAPDTLVMAAGDKVFLTHEGSKVLIKVPTTDLVTYNPAARVVDIDDGDNIDAGQVVLAAGDIFSAALDVGSLAATANRDITLEGAITADGHVEILGGQKDGYFSNADIQIEDDITAASMRIKNGKDEYPGEESLSGIYVADGKSLTATDGDVVVEAVHDVILGGNVTASGDIFINGDEDGYGDPQGDNYNPKPSGGGDLWAKGELNAGGDVEIRGNDILLESAVDAGGNLTITGATSEDESGETLFNADSALGDVHAVRTLSAGGSIEISATDDTVYLDDDVTAALDLVLNNDTVAAHEVELTAGQNVNIASGKTVTALGSLGIEATGGEIMADTSIIDMTADGQTLALTQNDNMDLEQDFSVNNRTNTNLVADSTGGSVTSDAAGEWGSITAHAADNITLSDISEVITTGALEADTGDVKVTSVDGKVEVYGPVSAGQDVIITATDEGTDGSDNAILLYGDVEVGQTIEAGRDIWLNNNTWAADDLSLQAGEDVRIGWQGDQSPWDPASGYYAPKTLTGAGALTIEADRHITLGGDVEIEDNVILWADKDDGGDPGGDMTALGNITSNSGNIDIYASDSTIILTGDKVEASGDVTLHDNTVLNGGDQRIDALTGKLITDDGVNMDKSTAGDVDLGGGLGIELGGNVTGTGMTDADTMTFEDNVTANGSGNQRIDAGAGALAANGSINKITSGDLNLGGDEAIDLDGTVDVDSGSLTIEDDFTAAADLIASQNVTLEGSATLDGSVNQKIEATNGSLYANDSVHKTGTGNLDMFGGYNGPLYPDMDYSVKTKAVTVDEGELSIAGNATVRLDGSIYSKGNMTLASNVDGIDSTPSQATPSSSPVPYDYLVHYNGTIQSLNGDIDISAQDDVIYLDGGNNMPDAYVSAGGDILLRDWTWVQYSNKLDAGHNVEAFSTLHGNGSLTVLADNDILLRANVSSVGAMTMDAGSNIELNRNSGNTSSESTISLNAGDSISVGRPFSGEGNVTANGNMDITAGTDSGDNVKVLGKLTTTNGGNINVKAGGDIRLYGTFNDSEFESAEADGDLTLDAEYDVDVLGDLISNNGSIDIYSSDDTTYLGGDVFAAYDVTLHNNTILDGGDSQIIEAGLVGNGTMTAGGWLWKTTTGHLYLGGYNSEPEHRDGKAIDLQYAGCLPAASTCLGNLDLYAPDGDIQISGDLTTFGICDFGDRVESTENGSCWEYWYDRPTGGVSVIAENGKIYTAADSPDPAAGDYMLNIGISGNSDDVSHRMVPDNGYEYVQIDMPQLGVDIPELPWFDEGEGEDGKAAIVVLSRDDLIFGPDTMLIAKGNYDSSVVDDRPEVDFLADPLTSIGGIVRDEGDQIDVAIYAGSMGTEEGQGNVHLNGRAIDVAEAGTMVVDAYDTVTFGDFDTFNLENLEGCKDLGCFFMKLAMRFHEENLHEAFGQYVELNGWYEGVLEDFLNDSYDEDFFFNIDRLEVVSRITEWLYQASENGTLPYPYHPEVVEAFIGGDYVLRGAGRGNPFITDGRAWILEDPTPPAPLYTEAGETSEKEEFREGGCTALMNWLADEIGVPAGNIQVAVAGAYALSTDVQPCEMCARLKDASNILQDVEGTQIAALARVVNEFVTTPAPPSPEQMTSIASALAEHTGDGTYYAAAGEWIDALVAYIGIMRTEMGYSASDAASFAEKYLTRVNESGNAALVAYVQARLAALGG